MAETSKLRIPSKLTIEQTLQIESISFILMFHLHIEKATALINSCACSINQPEKRDFFFLTKANQL